MIEWPAGIKLIALMAKHPLVVARLIGAMIGAGIAVTFHKDRRFPKFVIGMVFGSIFSPLYFEISGTIPEIHTALACATAFGLVAYTLLHFWFSKDTQDAAKSIFWHQVKKRLGDE